MNTPPYKNGDTTPPSTPPFDESSFFHIYAEANPSPILVTCPAGFIQYVNTAWVKLTGYSKAEVRGKNPRFLSSGRTAPEVYKQLWKALRAGQPFETEDMIDKRKDGTEFSLRSVYFPVHMSGSTYFVQVMQDISQRKWTEKRKDAFISTASHELRNPLSTIIFSHDLLKQELGMMSEHAHQIFETLEDETRRFTALLNYLLDANKLQNSALHIRLEAHDLRQQVQQITGELQHVFPSHSIDVLIGERPVKFMYDEPRIAQVLINLISNAVKYSPKANRIVVRLNSTDRDATVSVQDFGFGIATEEREKIFEALYRAKNVGNIDGHGLGLYISAQIAAAHGGHLQVSSKHAEGTTFRLSLPLNNTPR